MGGGLMQLVAYGAQDAFLTGNPEITFFKVVYRRHTNFAMESIVQDFNGTGLRKTATISRNGDLVTNCWLEGCYTDTDPDTDGVQPGSGNDSGVSLIDSIDLEIGGQRIDKHYGEWMQIWTELSCPVGKRNGKDALDAKGVVPLEFFFCRNPGLALPLIALQYHEVKLTFNLHKAAPDLKLYVDYIYLDTDERRRFAQVQHNMLIDQLQQQDGGSGSNTRLNFNHPCKELVWLGGKDDSTLKLNGHERFSKRGMEYFQMVQPYQHHSNVPMTNSATPVLATVKGTALVNVDASGDPLGDQSSELNSGEKAKGTLRAQNQAINVYSFALKPEEHQPSGTCNFSRIDNAQLDAQCSVVYAVNYNVLRIMSGMGGLAFSN